MLDDFFTDFLNINFPPEYVDLINNCRDSLYNYGFSLVEANLYKTIPDNMGIDLFTSKALFTQCIIDGYTEVFIQLGIRTGLRDLQELDKILRAVKNLEESHDHEVILETINNDERTQSEILEDLLMFALPAMDLTEVLFNIELINGNAFINKFYEHHLDLYRSKTGEATSDRPDRVYLDRVKDFILKYPETLVARKYNSKDILFGETFRHYIDENAEDLMLFYPTAADKVVSEFVGLAIIANIQPHDLTGHVKTAISKFYNDLKFTTQTSYLVDKFMEGMSYDN